MHVVLGMNRKIKLSIYKGTKWCGKHIIFIRRGRLVIQGAIRGTTSY
jgi:hypothetical protein